MRPADPQLIDLLAAEYVLGTLGGPARRRLARWAQDLPDVQRAVRRWEDRLLPMALALAPVEPPLHVWTAIRRRIKSLGASGAVQTQVVRERHWRWAAAVALLGVIIALWNGPAREQPPYAVASVTATNGQVLWRVAVNATQETLLIRVVAPEAHSPRQDFELWALPADGGSPVSLGLMPAKGAISHRLSINQRDAVRAAAKLAVSLEPRGGSPTGAPTGPVVHVADLRLSG